MNKEIFLIELEKNLKALDVEERNEILRYYNEYIDDLAVSEEGLKAIPNPKQVANQILSDSYIKNIENTNSSTKKGFSTIALIFTSILAAPIALPIAVALIIVAFALVLSMVLLILSFYLCAISFTLAGILSFGISFIALPLNFLTFMFLLGTGFAMFPLGIFIFSWMSRFVKFITKKISTFFIRRFNSRKVVI